MKKILLLLLIFPLVFFGQETIFKNGVEVIYPIGYNYDFELSTKEKAHFISEKKEELLVYVFKFRKHITVDIINELLLSENSSINWKLFNGPTGGKWSTISTGINGVYGYRTAFKLDSKLVLIQSFALSYDEALKSVLKASEEIQAKNE